MRASQRNPEVVAWGLRAAALVWVHHIQEVALDGFVIDNSAVHVIKALRLGAIRQQLQGANAVPADGGQQVERVNGARLEPGRNPSANRIAVGQQAVEVVEDAP